ncbi:MAG: protein kinase, partial [Chitinivibrionales bacterium]|nr:protein kinase [Chitinivibrionales bacterium]MBD3394507.1 protein kinase [Chitinivibrionales bacterium]
MMDDITGSAAAFSRVGAPFTTGDMIGNLRVDQLIAEGGMGFVCRAWRTDLDVVRAVKVLKPGLSQDSRARFLTEAKISANLDHSNIVRIYNTGFWRQTLPYIEMEYIDGNSLTELLRRHGRLPAPVCVAIISIIAAALDYASRQSFIVQGQTHDGLVHRDIKPGNILVSKQGLVKLSDFGLAQIGDVSLHTQQGAVMGTNIYMSPEQLEGVRADRRCDIYAAGLVLYEALCGRRAFDQMSLPQLIAAKTQGKIEPIARRAPDAPRPIARIVERCVETDPRKRYRTYEQLQFACENALADMTASDAADVVADFVSTPGSAARIAAPLSSVARRGRMVAGIVLAAAIAAAGIWAIRYFFVRREDTNPPVRESSAGALPRPRAEARQARLPSAGGPSDKTGAPERERAPRARETQKAPRPAAPPSRSSAR